ncbi:MAG: divergent PAP2 family protein [Bacilli bacterium]
MWFIALLRGVGHNTALLAAVASILVAQGIKVPIFYWTDREWDVSKMMSTGGMPSSHSAAVSSLATVVGIRAGTGSMLFAASVVFAIIVMYDAAGIRRHAGEQAIAINKLAAEIGKYIDSWPMALRNEAYQKKLKEMLGHQPIEVFMGCILGIAIAVIATL